MISVIIPVYNEEQHIENVLRKIPKDYEIIVVNDSSKDGTRKVAERFVTKVVNHSRRKGKGAACKTGAKNASNDILVFIDGDDQFEPSEIPRFLKTLNGADFVIGFRTEFPFWRKLSNKYARASVSLATGQAFKDALCGFKAIRKDVYNSLNLRMNDYRTDVEMILESMKRNYDIRQVPVSVKYTKEIKTHISFIDNLKIGGFIFFHTLKSILKRL